MTVELSYTDRGGWFGGEVIAGYSGYSVKHREVFNNVYPFLSIDKGWVRLA